jgi:methionine sulfoxide reductase heme-binding subunit
MNRLTLLRGMMHLGALLPLALLIVDALNRQLTFNPIRAATQRTGDTAILLLGLSLACSPLSAYFKWEDALKLHRALSLYAFLYATVHVGLFVGVNLGFQLNFIVPEFLQKYYLWAGLPAFVILVALAATSSRWSMRRLGQNWKRLHRSIYLAAILVVLHVALVIKGDFFRLTGDVWKPLIAVAVLTVLLIVRVPPLRRTLLARQHRGQPKTRSALR